MTTALSKLTQTLATKLDMGDGADLISTLKATAFKGDVTDAQMTALLVIANQYGLNPWVKEIYAFPDKQNGIVPVVGVDGWSRIMNEHPQFDGIEFEQSTIMADMPGAKPAPEWMECRIYRKDRTRPIVVREYLDEVYRPPFTGKYGAVNGPWQSHTKRFLRHKTMIQCARFGSPGASSAHREHGHGRRSAATTAKANSRMARRQMGRHPAQDAPRHRPGQKRGRCPGMAPSQRDGHTSPRARATHSSRPAADGPGTGRTGSQHNPDRKRRQAGPGHAGSNRPCTLYEQAALMDAVTDEGARLRLNEVFDAKQAELEAA